MTSKSPAGRGEIDAVRHRLAVAKKWEAAAADAVEAARKRLKDAEGHQNDAREEVREAESYLEGLDRKWEVIDVDGDSPAPSRHESKRQKRSTDTCDTGHGTVRRTDGVVTPSTSTTRDCGDGSIQFDLIVPPGKLGITVTDQLLGDMYGCLVVTGCKEDSQFAGILEYGDEIVASNGVCTDHVPVCFFGKLLMEQKTEGEQKITIRRRLLRSCLKFNEE